MENLGYKSTAPIYLIQPSDGKQMENREADMSTGSGWQLQEARVHLLS